MLTVYRSVVLIACIILVIMLTIQLFYTANVAATKLQHGSQTDTGIFPKRSRNVNAWYLVTTDPSDPSTTAYPIIFPPPPAGSNGTTYMSNLPARIGIAKTTTCPIFRAQDNGSTNPPLIG